MRPGDVAIDLGAPGGEERLHQVRDPRGVAAGATTAHPVHQVTQMTKVSSAGSALGQTIHLITDRGQPEDARPTLTR